MRMDVTIKVALQANVQCNIKGNKEKKKWQKYCQDSKQHFGALKNFLSYQHYGKIGHPT